MEMSRLSYTSVTDYMDMTIRDMFMFRSALASVLEREKEAREKAREQ